MEQRKPLGTRDWKYFHKNKDSIMNYDNVGVSETLPAIQTFKKLGYVTIAGRGQYIVYGFIMN